MRGRSILDIAGSIAAALLCVWAASRLTLVTAVAGLSAVWIASLAVLQISFANALWLDATSVIAAALTASLAGLLARQWVLKRRAANLARYGSPLIVESLASGQRPEFEGRSQFAAALFVDAIGFTQLSDGLGASGTASFLKAYHEVVSKAAHMHGGTVEHFAGDGAMIDLSRLQGGLTRVQVGKSRCEGGFFVPRLRLILTGSIRLPECLSEHSTWNLRPGR